MKSSIYIGLMSGTSTDGVDGVLADFSRPAKPDVLAHCALPMPQALRTEFLALNHPGPNELARASLASNALADVYARVVHALLAQSRIAPDAVAAIGAHGQTVRHQPQDGYSIQLNAPARLAERTGIAVIADFRARDIAAGGQGAPLVPAFHQALFGGGPAPLAILNLGGIANLTVLRPGQAPLGFDSGPANMLLDAWIQRHHGQAYDEDGRWAASGQASAELVALLLASEPWLDQPPPKSTGRDLFNLGWLDARLESYREKGGRALSGADIQASLLAFTVRTVGDAVRRHAGGATEVLACGGGAHNTALMQALAGALPCPLRTTAARGVPVQMVEALAFAWLAWAWDAGHAAGLPQVTGAAGPRVLGCHYPAR